jgi:hypothetical protein
MEPSNELIHRLRSLAAEGAGVRQMVGEIRNHSGTDDGLPFLADFYFRKAFLLGLRHIKDIEASSCLGGKTYTDEQIDEIMLPRIASTRHLWETK